MRAGRSWVLVGFIVLTNLSSGVAAQEVRRPSAEEWARLARPGEHHRRLDLLVGRWDLVVRYAPESGDRWTEARGTAEFRWAMDGRFLVETTRTEFGGAPFEWMAFHGFDNMKKRYVSAWIDNLGTAVDHMEAEPDASGRVINYTAQEDDPATGAVKTVIWRITLEGTDRFRTEMFEQPRGQPAKKALEIVGTRAR